MRKLSCGCDAFIRSGYLCIAKESVFKACQCTLTSRIGLAAQPFPYKVVKTSDSEASHKLRLVLNLCCRAVEHILYYALLRAQQTQDTSLPARLAQQQPLIRHISLAARFLGTFLCIRASFTGNL